MSLSYNFEGKVALVTGSSSGLGSGIARKLAKAGASVVVTGRDAASVAKVAKECYELSPKRIRPLEVVADITHESDAERLVRETMNRFNRLDVLVNNAGSCEFTTTADVSTALHNYDRIMALDVRSLVHITLLAVPHLAKTKGNIVNISSICAMKPMAGLFAYNMAKAAVDIFTQAIALELGPQGIRVNAINSGAIKSQFFNRFMTAEQATQQENILRDSSPLGLLAEPEDIANVVLYVACNEAARFMTGSCVVCDGGVLFSAITVAK